MSACAAAVAQPAGIGDATQQAGAADGGGHHVQEIGPSGAPMEADACDEAGTSQPLLTAEGAGRASPSAAVETTAACALPEADAPSSSSSAAVDCGSGRRPASRADNLAAAALDLSVELLSESKAAEPHTADAKRPATAAAEENRADAMPLLDRAHNGNGKATADRPTSASDDSVILEESDCSGTGGSFDEFLSGRPPATKRARYDGDQSRCRKSVLDDLSDDEEDEEGDSDEDDEQEEVDDDAVSTSGSGASVRHVLQSRFGSTAAYLEAMKRRHRPAPNGHRGAPGVPSPLAPAASASPRSDTPAGEGSANTTASSTQRDADLTVESIRARWLRFATDAGSGAENVVGRAAKLDDYRLTDLFCTFLERLGRAGAAAEASVLDALDPQLTDEPLVFPNSVVFPPSQVVGMVSCYEADTDVKAYRKAQFGTDQVPVSAKERRDRLHLRAASQAPGFAYATFSLGLDLVQEHVYSDIVGKRSALTAQQDEEQWQSICRQLVPLREQLVEKNKGYVHALSHECTVCKFRTASALVLAAHQRKPRRAPYEHRWRCGYCTVSRSHWADMCAHYRDEHGTEADTPDVEPSMPRGHRHTCPICVRTFQFKGARDAHIRECKRTPIGLRPMQTVGNYLECAVWQWPRPAVACLVESPNVLNRGQAAWLHGRATGVVDSTPVDGTRFVLRSAGRPVLCKRKPAAAIVVRQPAGSAAAAATGSMGSQWGSSAMRYPGSKQPHPRQQMRNGTYSSVMRFRARANLPLAPTAPSSVTSVQLAALKLRFDCELCDQQFAGAPGYLTHMQTMHQQLLRKVWTDLAHGAPLGCSKCSSRWWCYAGLERHLLLSHGLVTADLLAKARARADSGRCRLCHKQFAFNILQHLAAEHGVQLCSAEIVYSCDVCPFKCDSHRQLEEHLERVHYAGQPPAIAPVVPRFGQAARWPRPQGPAASLFTTHRQRPLMARSRATVHRPVQPQNAHRKVKYTCTPCALRFEEYSAVITHWQQKHLKQLKVDVCRVDKCAVHRETIEQNYCVDWTPPRPVDDGDDDDVPLSLLVPPGRSTSHKAVARRGRSFRSRGGKTFHGTITLD